MICSLKCIFLIQQNVYLPIILNYLIVPSYCMPVVTGMQ